MYQLRHSHSSDADLIRRLHEVAFGDDEGASIGQLALDLLSDPAANPQLSLIAERDGQVIGHVLFSPITVNDSDNDQAYILAPLGVHPDWQDHGVGSRLIMTGLQELRSRGADWAMVLGDPDYYGRFGFHSGHRIKPPFEINYLEAWLAVEWMPGVLDRAEGVARCADALMVREYW